MIDIDILTCIFQHVIFIQRPLIRPVTFSFALHEVCEWLFTMTEKYFDKIIAT